MNRLPQFLRRRIHVRRRRHRRDYRDAPGAPGYHLMEVVGLESAHAGEWNRNARANDVDHLGTYHARGHIFRLGGEYGPMLM